MGVRLEGWQAEGGTRAGAPCCTAPNNALEPTANGVRCAPALGGGSPRALGRLLARSIGIRMKSAVARLSIVLAFLMFSGPLAAGAQPVGKVYRIGILGDKASDASLWESFRAGLREHGWNDE